ncbi:MAG TPA: universal stress protein [Steroidobacter sp.]|nr:universal stress protein [Steroidobacter sp.]
MTEFQTMLAAIATHQERAQTVLKRAAQLSFAFGAQLILYHATFEPALSGRPFFDTKRLARSRAWLVEERTQALDAHARKLRSQGLAVRTQVLSEEPAYESIMRAAIRQRVDLVVAGPHSRSRTTPLPRHTDWQLLRLCSRPGKRPICTLQKTAAQRVAIGSGGWDGRREA